MQNWQNLVIPESFTVKQALSVYDAQGKGIVCICDDNNHLKGIITDGDFRRAMASDEVLSLPCTNIMNAQPAHVSEEYTSAQALYIMDKSRPYRMLQLPVLDNRGHLIDILLREEFSCAPLPKPRAMIMAGGFGTRLYPLTKDTPKPMLPVGDKPLLERIILKVRDAGITDIILTTHYLPEVIRNYFGDGRKFGVDISYIHEEKPLGTAGALSLLDLPSDDQAPLLVMNGDILSDIDLGCMLRKHYSNGAAITVATRQYDMQVPYGVIDVTERGQVEKLVEKPTHVFQVSAGIYLLQPTTFNHLVEGEVSQMPDVITKSLDLGYRVDSFIIHEEWLDIGQAKDYERAQNIVKAGV